MKVTQNSKNPYFYYETAVQSVDYDIAFLTKLFQRKRGRIPIKLREDFCGTFSLCTEWVKSHKKRRAIGIDLAARPLRDGKRRHWQALEPEQKARIKILRQNVLSHTAPADIIVAQNFSYFTFHKRSELQHYFKCALRSLNKQGMLVLDIFGGPSAETPRVEKQKIRSPGVPAFHYYWELVKFNSVQRRGDFRIHFQIDSRTILQNAFRYDWRMWTIPEVREILEEAGFRRTEVLWEGDHSNYFKTERGTDDDTWLACIVAEK